MTDKLVTLLVTLGHQFILALIICKIGYSSLHANMNDGFYFGIAAKTRFIWCKKLFLKQSLNEAFFVIIYFCNGCQRDTI